jgi:hypothetical protein
MRKARRRRRERERLRGFDRFVAKRGGSVMATVEAPRSQPRVPEEAS